MKPEPIIKNILDKRGITVSEFAKMIDMKHVGTASLIALGYCIPSDAEKRQKIASVLGVEERQIFPSDEAEAGELSGFERNKTIAIDCLKGVKYVEIARKHNLSTPRVSQIFSKMVQVVRAAYPQVHIEDYLSGIDMSEEKLAQCIKCISELSSDNWFKLAVFDGIPLSGRSYRCLKFLGIRSVSELLNEDPRRILGVRSFGKKGFKEIAQALIERGYTLSDEWRKALGDK